MKSFRILSASVNPSTGFIEVVKEITADDNSISLNLHVFHREALEWKAAEFDTDDIDEVIDGILHEPFFEEDINSLQLNTEDAKTKFRANLASAKARLTNNIPRNPVTIKAQMRVAGVDDRYIDAVDNDPVQVIKVACLFDAEVITAKRIYTNKVRNKAVADIAEAAAMGPKGPLTVEQRIAQIGANRSTTASGTVHKQPEVTPTKGQQAPILLEKSKRKIVGG
jgi:hypothetical protein